MKRFVSILLGLVLGLCGVTGQTLDPVLLGTSPNDGTGDPLRTAFEKLNRNDSNLWTQAFTTLPTLVAGVSNTPAEILILDTMADLVSLGTTPPAVYLRGYSSNGIGAGFWVFDATSTFGTNRGIPAHPTGAVTGRYWPTFEHGRVDVTKFGVVPGTTNQDAADDAILVRNDVTVPASILYLPAADSAYYFTKSFTNTLDKRFHILGDGRNTAYEAPARMRWGSQIVMVTDNTPILTPTGTEGTIKGVSLSYSNDQPSANTLAAAIKPVGALNGRWQIDDVGIKHAAYGIHFPNNLGGTVNNTRMKEVYITDCSISALHLDGGGTVHEIGQLYLQNADPSAVRNLAITSAVNAAGQITLTSSGAIPPGLSTNCYVVLSGFGTTNNATGATNSSVANTFFVIRAVSGANYIVDTPAGTDNNFTFYDVTGNLEFSSAGAATGPAIFIGAGTEVNGAGWDIEINRVPTGKMFHNQGKTTVGNLHVEFSYPSTDPGGLSAFVVNDGGTLAIQKAQLENSGVPLGWSMAFLRNENRGVIPGIFTVDNVGIRDVAANGSTFAVATHETGASPVVIGQLTDTYTIRANATGTFSGGTAVTPLYSHQVRTAGNQALQNTSGSLYAYDLRYEVNNSGTGGHRGYVWDSIRTALGSGEDIGWDYRINGRSMWRNAGGIGFFEYGPELSVATGRSRIQMLVDQVLDVRMSIGGNYIQTAESDAGTAGASLLINTSAPIASNTLIGPGTIGVGTRFGNLTNSVLSNYVRGRVTLVAGTATVPLGWVTGSTPIAIVPYAAGGTPGTQYYTDTRTPGTSFTITSTSGTDTSVVDWMAFGE